jgi:hypothetical protein
MQNTCFNESRKLFKLRVVVCIMTLYHLYELYNVELHQMHCFKVLFQYFPAEI